VARFKRSYPRSLYTRQTPVTFAMQAGTLRQAPPGRHYQPPAPRARVGPRSVGGGVAGPAPGIHHIQDKTAQAGSSNTATVAINSQAGNTLVLYVLGAQNGNNPFALATVTDSTGTNVWHYSTQQQSQAPPVAGAYNGVSVYQIAALAYCINAAAVTSVTVTTTGVSANSSVFAAVSEFSGVPPQATIDGSAAANTVATASSDTSPSINVTGSADVLAACNYNNGTLSSVSAGWTSFDPNFTVAAWQITSAPVSASITWSFTAPALYTASVIFALGIPRQVPPQLPPTVVAIHRPLPARARLGSNLFCGSGAGAPFPAQVPVPSRPNPFVFRSPAPARARCGPRSNAAAGVASQVVTPLGAGPSPAPRPVIVHLPPHRAKVGPGTYLAAGVESQVVTPLGLQQQPPPRPVIVHVPAARARLGLRSQAAGGVPSAVTTPLGSPSQPASRPVVQHLPPHRVLWRGGGTQNYPQPATAYQARPFIFRPPAPARGRLGNGLRTGGGVASAVVTPLGSGSQPAPQPVIQHLPSRRAVWRGLAAAPPPAVTAYQRPPVQVRRPAPARALWHGLASQVVTPLGAPSRTEPGWVFRSPAPARALWRGYASQIVTPLGAPPSPLPRPVIQHLPPHRARTGSSLQCGAGVASQVVTPLGVLGPPRPFVWRSPAPARGRLGTRGLAGAGAASAIVTPLGSIGPPRPFVFRSPAPARTRLGSLGTAAGGVAGLVNLTQQPYQRPAPQIRRPAPARGQAGQRGTAAAGIASQVVTPLGVIAPPRKVQIFPPKITRAWVGRSAVGAGIASVGNLPAGPQMYQRPAPYIKRPAPSRASLGPNHLAAGGIASPVVTPLGSLGPPSPFVWRAPLPARARFGLQPWGGVTGPANMAVTAYQRPPVQVKRPAPARAVLGSRGMLAGGVASQTVTPLGSLPPARKVPVFPPKTTRATTGYSTTGGGVYGPTNPAPGPLFIYTYQQQLTRIRRPAPARAIWRSGAAPSAAVAAPAYTYEQKLGRIKRSIPARGIWHGAPGTPPAAPLYTYTQKLGRIKRPAPARGIWRNAVGTHPLGPVQVSLPVVEFRPPPPTRAVWRGYASQTVTPLGSPPALPKPLPPQARRPAPARATWAGGRGPANLPPAASSYQRPAPYIKRPSPARAAVGPRNTAAGGFAGLINQPAAASSYLRPQPYIKRPAPARGITGPRGATAGGIASQIVTPLGSPVPPRPFVWRPPTPARGRAGSRSSVAGGIAGLPAPPGAPSRPYPFVFRSPAPARARIMPRGGVASRIVTPLGSLAPPRKVPLFPPKITRARVGAGTIAGGIASQVVTPPPPAPPIVPGVTGTAVPQNLAGTTTPADLTGTAAAQNITGTAAKG